MTKKFNVFLLIFTIAALLSAGLTAPSARAQQGGLGIAAVVNDDLVSALDLYTRVTMVMVSSGIEDTPENRARVSPQVLRGLIDEKLMLQEAHRIGIKVVQSDIDNGLVQLAANNNMNTNEFVNSLAQMGVPVTALTSRIESEIAWQAFVFRTLKNKIKISEDEISDEINRLQASTGKPEYLLAEIFLPVDTPAQDSEVRQLATRLLEQLQQGAPFRALATNFSRAPSAAVGGDLGWVQYSHLDEALQKVVSQLQPGQLSLPVRALGGYYLILVRGERTSPGLGGGDAVMKLTQLHMAPHNPDDPNAMNALAAHLTSITQNVSGCAQLDALGQNVGSNLSGSMGEVSLSALPDGMRRVLAPMAVGQPSRPVPTAGGLAVMMICERHDQPADMESIRARIAERLLIERLDIAAEGHLRDLRRSAFVEIRL